MLLAQSDNNAFEDALEALGRFLPRLLAFLAILVIGFFLARLVAGILEKVLERVGFDKAVERGGVRTALAKTKYDASDVLGKLVFYAIFLFVLQAAFAVFGDQNPISELLTSVIAFLPKLFVAIVIVVLAAAIAAVVKELIEVSLGGLDYGRPLAFGASTVILVVGIFAALDQIDVAPLVVNGLFIAALAIVAGSAIVAIGGGGIQPMRQRWERALERFDEERPKVREEAKGSKEDIKERVNERKEQVQESSAATTKRNPTQGSVRP